MRIRAVLTDLDGTLLARDGSIPESARGALAALAAAGVPVAPLTSKTRVETLSAMSALGARWGSFENGAAVIGPASIDVSADAVPVGELRRALLRISEIVPVTALDTLTDRELERRTGLAPERLAGARAREYDLPFLATGVAPEGLARAAASAAPGLTLVAGGTFWHLMGPHGKRAAAVRILEAIGGEGVSVGLGDAANDDFLLAVDVPVVVPREDGPDAALVALVPGARVAPYPGGKGWAAAVTAISRARARRAR